MSNQKKALTLVNSEALLELLEATKELIGIAEWAEEHGANSQAIKAAVKYAKESMTQAKRMDYQLLAACQLAYRKHHLNHAEVGWTELSNELGDVLPEAMTDKVYCAWLEQFHAQGAC